MNRRGNRRSKSRGFAIISLALGIGLFVALLCSPTALVVLAALALIIIGIMLLRC